MISILIPIWAVLRRFLAGPTRRQRKCVGNYCRSSPPTTAAAFTHNNLFARFHSWTQLCPSGQKLRIDARSHWLFLNQVLGNLQPDRLATNPWALWWGSSRGLHFQDGDRISDLYTKQILVFCSLESSEAFGQLIEWRKPWPRL